MSKVNGRVYATRDLILNAVDTEYRDVEVPEWQTVVRIRSISAYERERLLKGSMVVEGTGKHAVQHFDMPTFKVKLAALAMVGVEGERLFSEADVHLLGRKNARAVERVSEAAMELANVQDDTKDDGDDEGEDGEGDPGKDSAPTPRTASASSSASRSAG